MLDLRGSPHLRINVHLVRQDLEHHLGLPLNIGHPLQAIFFSYQLFGMGTKSLVLGKQRFVLCLRHATLTGLESQLLGLILES